MARRIENGIGGADFDHSAQIHDRNAVGDMFHDTQVVTDENECQTELFLQILEKIENLRLNGHIKRGYRLVADDGLRLGSKRARNHHALALAAGKLVRIAACLFGTQTHHFQKLRHAFGAL